MNHMNYGGSYDGEAVDFGLTSAGTMTDLFSSALYHTVYTTEKYLKHIPSELAISGKFTKIAKTTGTVGNILMIATAGNELITGTAGPHTLVDLTVGIGLAISAVYWVTPVGWATLAGIGLTYGVISVIGSKSFDNWVYRKIK